MWWEKGVDEEATLDSPHRIPIEDRIDLHAFSPKEVVSVVEEYLEEASRQLERWEFFAEELRLAQVALAEITGEVSADDLLGEIFARFCIGK